MLRFRANDRLEKAIAERPASLAAEAIRQYIRLNGKIVLIYLLSCIAFFVLLYDPHLKSSKIEIFAFLL